MTHLCSSISFRLCLFLLFASSVYISLPHTQTHTRTRTHKHILVFAVFFYFIIHLWFHLFSLFIFIHFTPLLITEPLGCQTRHSAVLKQTRCDTADPLPRSDASVRTWRNVTNVQSRQGGLNQPTLQTRPELTAPPLRKPQRRVR